MFGRFFFRAQIDAAQLLALLLELFDALLGLLEGREILLILEAGAFRQFAGRDLQFVADAFGEFGDAGLCAFEQRFFAGPFLATVPGTDTYVDRL